MLFASFFNIYPIGHLAKTIRNNFQKPLFSDLTKDNGTMVLWSEDRAEIFVVQLINNSRSGVVNDWWFKQRTNSN